MYKILMLIAVVQLSVIAPLAENATRAVPLRRPLEMLLAAVRVLASVEVSNFHWHSFIEGFCSMEKMYINVGIGRGGRFPRERDDRHTHKSGATT
jgi:hypothetical protein